MPSSRQGGGIRNVELHPPLRLSAWRKIALGTWRSAGDPSVYGILELDVQAAEQHLERLRATTATRLTLSHFFGRAIAECFARHPEINCVLRFGRLYPRKHIDLFFQVATDERGQDLSGLTVRRADQKSIVEIAQEMRARIEEIREKGDPAFKKSKGMMAVFPGWGVSLALRLMGFVLYALNFWSPLLGPPRDAFGSAMITNIGSLGLDMAFAPLVPYSRVPILFALGAAAPAPVVRDGRVEARRMLKVCVTFDHRLIDGVHAARMAKTLHAIFADPEKELGI